ncbi:Ribose import ATP-binding protein RbsA [Serratia fonticola]|uniref:Ribose import ATP-binding protein RbsA n=1 Tax=Serratia fonticola TaxID=47917 RepID=A0A4U9WQA1_SERFO|nr:Ribose import ATP-binding protein RbsA [Serratia fonticola]
MLRNGKLVGTRVTAELPRLELVQMMLGHSFDETLLKRSEHQAVQAPPLVEFSGYGRRGMVEPFDLAIRPGEIVGLAGLLGSGRTETAQLIFGIKARIKVQRRLKAKRWRSLRPVKRLAWDLVIAQKTRKTDGIVGAATVRENIILALQAQRGWLRPLPLREQTRIAEDFIKLLGIRTPGPEQQIQYLSGGNQQKVLLSRWLATKPRFLILDEPTRGIDVGAHAEIIRLIERLCDEGLALLVISSELEELAGYADRIVVLRDRKHVAQLEHGCHYGSRHYAGHCRATGGSMNHRSFPMTGGPRKVRWVMPVGATQLGALAVILLIDSLVAPHFFSIHIQDGRLFGSVIDIFNPWCPCCTACLGYDVSDRYRWDRSLRRCGDGDCRGDRCHHDQRWLPH